MYGNSSINSRALEKQNHDRNVNINNQSYYQSQSRALVPAQYSSNQGSSLSGSQQLASVVPGMSFMGAATDSYEGLKEAFRTLQGHYVELQIELQSAKTDRDSLLLELRASKEALAEVNSSHYGPIAVGPSSLMSDMTATVYTSEKSMKDLKDVLARKEEMIDKLLADLTDEKHARAAAEQSAKAEMVRHLTEMEEMKRKVANLNEKVEKGKVEVSQIEQSRMTILNELNHKNKIIDELNEKYKLQSQTMLGLVSQIEAVKGELFNMKELKEAGDATILELNRTLTEAKSDVNLVITERNNLRSLVAQQDAALRVQSEQSDASLNILQQRQGIIEKYEMHSKSVEEELHKLQSILQSVIARNGDELLSEIIDVRHLVNIISNARNKLGLKNPNSPDMSNIVQSFMPSNRGEGHPIRALSSYPSSVIESEAVRVRQLAEENERLRIECSRATDDAKFARDELSQAKDNMQKEYEALWITVHELNKLDNARDREMNDLILSRDAMMKERNASNDRLKRLVDAYNELQQELKSIDQDLLAVAEAENIQIVKADTRRRIRGLIRH